jgi:hypothetical protein
MSPVYTEGGLAPAEIEWHSLVRTFRVSGYAAAGASRLS